MQTLLTLIKDKHLLSRSSKHTSFSSFLVLPFYTTRVLYEQNHEDAVNNKVCNQINYPALMDPALPERS